jgi:8-oxo-dGTP pyrophosphatase MutT (NUDIX family)
MMTTAFRAPDLHAAAVATLTAWRAPSPEQDALRRDFLRHLAVHPDGVWRDGPAEHLTASCFVLDEAAESVLLTFHRKGRFWVQFGGHCEPRDAALRETALREGLEESGLSELGLWADPIDLDRHALPPQFGRCREHLDVAYLAVVRRASVPTANHESEQVAWWRLDGLPHGIVPDLPARLERAAAAVTRAGR